MAKKSPGEYPINFGYKMLKTISLEAGYAMVNSFPRRKFDRLQVLVRLSLITGPTCVCCKTQGINFSLGKDNGNGTHWDMYSDDGSAMTIDHILPKSNGGEDKIENIQLMCARCNSIKGNKPNRLIAYKSILEFGYYKVIVTDKFIRIDYWKKMDSDLFSSLQDILIEESMYDEDCGFLYTYYFKN